MDRNINLLTKEEKIDQFKSKAVKASTVFTIILMLAVGGLSFYYYGKARALKSSITSAGNRISNARGKIDDMSETEIVARNLYKKYSVISDIFDERIRFSSLFDHFDSKVPSGVFISSLNFRGAGEINISGDANNYILVSQFLDNLNSDDEAQIFSEANLSSASLNATDRSVSFSISITYDSDIIRGTN